jgi:hypothetical protein
VVGGKLRRHLLDRGQPFGEIRHRGLERLDPRQELRRGRDGNRRPATQEKPVEEVARVADIALSVAVDVTVERGFPAAAFLGFKE